MKKIAFGISVMVLCVSMTFMPANASDFPLSVFGNANMDDTIDEKDVAYVEGVIKGTNPATNLSNANHNGRIDAKCLYPEDFKDLDPERALQSSARDSCQSTAAAFG